MRLLWTVLILAFSIYIMEAQAPNSFNYQGVARDLTGQILPNKSIALKIMIVKGDDSGIVQYSETHSVVTSKLGLFTIRIGNGNNVVGDIGLIRWGEGSYFLRTEMDADGGSNYQYLGMSPLLSVPYALYSENTNLQSGDGIRITGNLIENTGDKSDTNELQKLNITGDSLFISEGNAVGLPKINAFWREDDSTLYYRDKPVNIGFMEADLSSDTIHAAKSSSPLNILSDDAHNLITFYRREKEDTNSVTMYHLGDGIGLYGNPSKSNYLYMTTQGIGTNKSYIGDYGLGISRYFWLSPATYNNKKMLSLQGEQGIKLGDPGRQVYFTSSGDIFLENSSMGVIHKSPNGKCWKQTVDDNGIFRSTQVTCPD